MAPASLLLTSQLPAGWPHLLLQLGSLVPRPAGVPKVKAFIDKHPEALAYDKANDIVSLVA